MITIRAIFDNGDSIITRLNGSLKDAEQYYLGQVFNLGAANDDMHRCVSVEEVPHYGNGC